MQGSSAQESAADTLKTPLAEQGEWSSKIDPVTPVSTATNNTAITPSRQPFPRRLSLLHTDASSSSSAAVPGTGAEAVSLARKTSLNGPGPETPRRGKRMSLAYIPSPSTSTAAVADPSSSRRVSDKSKTHASSCSDTDDWLVSDDDATTVVTAAASNLHKSMAQRDSDRVEAQFHDVSLDRAMLAFVYIR